MNQPRLNTPRLADLRGGLVRVPPLPNPVEPEKSPEFVEYWRAIMLHKWSILTLVLLTATIVWIVVSQMRPVYGGSATVLIESAKPNIVSIEEIYSGASANREYFQTQAEVLKSREVARRVVKRLGLTTHPDFDPRQAKPAPWRLWLSNAMPFRSSPSPSAAMDEAAVESAVMGAFASRLTVESIRISQLLRVKFEAHEPALAALVANAVAEAYIQADIDSRVETMQGAGQWISQRMKDLKRNLEASERALQAYREREGLLDQKTAGLGGIGRELDEFTQRLVEARVRRSIAEEAYNQVRTGVSNNFQSVPAVVASSSVQQLKAIENEAEKKFAHISQLYGPDHPTHVAAKNDLIAARANTTREIRTIVDSVQKEYRAALAIEKSIESALAESRRDIQTVNRKEIDLAALERDAATNRHLYETFLTRYRETSAAGDSRQANARLVDRAVPNNSPIRPDRTRAVALGAGIALIAGVLGALLLNQLNNTIRTTQDVETKLGQPLLTVLPLLKGEQKRSIARAMVRDPRGVYAEAIGTALTGLLLSTLDTPHKIVAITSSVPGEGKSTFALNLALAQAHAKRVLLIEGDLRAPLLAQTLRLPTAPPGLAELLIGSAEYEECVLQVDGTDLHLIVAGSLPPKPLQLLSSQRFTDLLAQLRTSYDLILLDTPPVQPVSDVLLMGGHLTGLIFVVEADETPVTTARSALKRIAAAGIPVLGVVLNRQDFKKAGRYYGETYGYSQEPYGMAYGQPEKIPARRV